MSKSFGTVNLLCVSLYVRTVWCGHNIAACHLVSTSAFEFFCPVGCAWKFHYLHREGAASQHIFVAFNSVSWNGWNLWLCCMEVYCPESWNKAFLESPLLDFEGHHPRALPFWMFLTWDTGLSMNVLQNVHEQSFFLFCFIFRGDANVHFFLSKESVAFLGFLKGFIIPQSLRTAALYRMFSNSAFNIQEA